MNANALRYFHTLRHLRWEQWVYRLLRRFPQRKPPLGPTPPQRRPDGQWQRFVWRLPNWDGTRFQFLNESHGLENGWDDPALPKLWRYNLHYFDHLASSGAGPECPQLVLRWIEDNPAAAGTGWEAYPTSLRIVNWIRWALSGQLLPLPALASLAQQARHLERNLEWHLLGNHLFVNAKALVFAGAWFDGAEASRWLVRGCEILLRELDEQFDADGGHFELSPMYHALAVEDVLDLLNLVNARPSAFAQGLGSTLATRLRTGLPQMLDWLAQMSHPDGEVAFFNDAAFGIAATPVQLSAYAAQLGLSATGRLAASGDLPASGYARLVAGPAVLIADAAAVGPDYLPGHAHADTLSFELSVHARRIIVNSGTSEYGTGPERQRQRGTAAHSTVEVAGANSSDVWAGFRVGARARIQRRHWQQDDDTIVLEACHDGYLARFATLHTRRWRLAPGRLTVEDTLSGPLHPSCARFHLHPDVVAAIDTDGRACRLQVAGRVVRLQVAGGTLELEASSWHPHFGRSVASSCLAVRLQRDSLLTTIEWQTDEDPVTEFLLSA